jgi:hypothetical protein
MRARAENVRERPRAGRSTACTPRAVVDALLNVPPTGEVQADIGLGVDEEVVRFEREA